jgi:hypothetical protein
MVERRRKYDVSEQEIDAVLLEFNNDHREAIRALLYDLDMLARDHALEVSRGYVRGHTWHVKLPQANSA